MRPLDLAVKTYRNARPIHDVHADRQVAFDEGFLEVVQHTGFFKQVLRVAQHEVEIAGFVAATGDATAVDPDFRVRGVCAQQSLDLLQIFLRQVELDGWGGRHEALFLVAESGAQDGFQCFGIRDEARQERQCFLGEAFAVVVGGAVAVGEPAFDFIHVHQAVGGGEAQ